MSWEPSRAEVPLARTVREDRADGRARAGQVTGDTGVARWSYRKVRRNSAFPAERVGNPSRVLSGQSACFSYRLSQRRSTLSPLSAEGSRHQHLYNQIAFIPLTSQQYQATKGTRGMPRHLGPMKDAADCDKPRGAVSGL